MEIGFSHHNDALKREMSHIISAYISELSSLIKRMPHDVLFEL